MAEDDPADDWKEAEPTTIDSRDFVEAINEDATPGAEAVPVAISDAKTPRPESTGRHRMTPAAFASAVDLADRDGYQRGFEHGQRAAKAEAEAAAVTELRRVREECVEAFRSFFVIWFGTWPATWEEAQAWYRSRLPPL